MAADDLVDLHAPWRTRGNAGGAQVRRAYTAKGKAKNYAIEWEAEGLVVAADAREANALLGLQLQELLAAQIHGVTEDASASSLARRAQRYRAWHKEGKRSPALLREYAGGRIGALPPQDPALPQWRKKLNVSGRLTRTTIRPRKRSAGEATATLNFPANRFDPRTTGDRTPRIVQEAQRLVPLLRGEVPAEWRAHWNKMLAEHADMSLAKTLDQLRRKRRALRDMKIAILRQIIGAIT